ncbi:MAG TPA: gluconokinase [Thermomicrobiales bacterium]|nr:gluconokinase [Thermomicrobiales bacterium]
MGVSGSGKSTIGALLAKKLDAGFTDGDRFHSASNIAKMAAGAPLDDSERLPWLEAIGKHLAASASSGSTEIVACSALKRQYRDVLRSYSPGLFVVFLDGPSDVIRERIARRNHAFMPSSLLESQLASLEPLGPDELGIRVDIMLPPEQIVGEVIARLSVESGALSTTR